MHRHRVVLAHAAGRVRAPRRELGRVHVAKPKAPRIGMGRVRPFGRPRARIARRRRLGDTAAGVRGEGDGVGGAGPVASACACHRMEFEPAARARAARGLAHGTSSGLVSKG